MSRISLPFHSEDISALARSLKGQLTNCEPRPTHLELLNMLVKANGYRNFQHYRAQITTQNQQKALSATFAVSEPDPDYFVRIKRLLKFFDTAGRLIRWPSKRSQQEICLWVIWSRLPARQVFTEKEVDRLLKDNHLFGDHTLLRRWLCDYGMMNRTTDGREYRRVEKRPPVEALELIRQIGSDRS